MLDTWIGTTILLTGAFTAATTDVLKFKVVNRLNVALATAGLVFHTAVYGIPGGVMSLSGLAAGLFSLLPLYAIGAIGAGDVKFVAALGSCLGIHQLLIVLFWGALANGIYGLALLLKDGDWKQFTSRITAPFRRRDRPTESVQVLVRSNERRSRLVPFSAMITVGLLVTLVLRHS